MVRGASAIGPSRAATLREADVCQHRAAESLHFDHRIAKEVRDVDFYRDRIYPRLVNSFGDPRPIRRLRRQLLPDARGDVLELGVGPGVNFIHYDPAKVGKLYALEPNAAMVQLAKRRQRGTRLDVVFLDLPGERIPLADASIDTVVSTFTLCTIPGVEEALRGVRRVTRSGGRLIFFEIAASPDAEVRRWQRRWEPIHRRLFEGLYLTRDIPGLLRQAGFEIASLTTGYMARFPRSWSHCCWGSAVVSGE
jgi:ubiquinone/menaquinone biosynthesis C-methylase UbiE